MTHGRHAVTVTTEDFGPKATSEQVPTTCEHRRRGSVSSVTVHWKTPMAQRARHRASTPVWGAHPINTPCNRHRGLPHARYVGAATHCLGPCMPTQVPPPTCSAQHFANLIILLRVKVSSCPMKLICPQRIPCKAEARRPPPNPPPATPRASLAPGNAHNAQTLVSPQRQRLPTSPPRRGLRGKRG